MYRFTLALSASLILSSSALAQVLDSSITQHKENQHATASETSALTGNFGIATQYIFRGLSQTNGKPALQGGLDFAHPSGLYAGTWFSNISWYTDQNAGVKTAPVALASPASAGDPYIPGQSNSTTLEWDLYGGFKGTLANDWTYDFGAVRYYYPGQYDSVGAYRNPDTTEVYAALGYKWVQFKYSKAVSTYTFGVNESSGASYADLTANIPVGDSGLTVLLHAGRQTYPTSANTGYWGSSGGNNDFFSYTDYKVAVSKEIRGFVYTLAWTQANTKDTAPDGNTTTYMNAFGKNIGRDRVAFSLLKNF
ncbi:MAG: hypothetical protein HYX44_15585 [Aquabacterium sp.]|nr:hypothetical protein [Aquabacterium sp.]